MNRRERIGGDSCRQKAGWVGFERRLGALREINSMVLRQLIDSELKSGREFFQFTVVYLTVSASSRKLSALRAPVAQLDRASDYGSEG